MRLKDWMNKPTQLEDDTFDRESIGQDVGDPVWPSAPLEPDVTLMRMPDPDAGEVRTLDGVLDFLDDVAEDVFNIPKEPRPPVRQDSRKRGPVIDVWTRGATSWRGAQFNISEAGGTRIVTERDDRVRAVVTNWGPGIAYLAATKGGVIAGPNMIQVAVGGQRIFHTADEVWAYPAIIGTLQIVDVQDEYGCPE